MLIVFVFSKLPNYKGFKGTIDQLVDNQYMVCGELAIIDSTTIEISELPVKTWTQVSCNLILRPLSQTLDGTR